MKLINKNKNKYIIRLDNGEEFINSLQNFCEKENIKVGWIQAIGSAQDINLAYFDTNLKDYEIKEFKEFLEIVTITGNIALKENKIFLHAHGLFSREDMSIIGGHIHRCVISATCEIVLFIGEGEMKREFDDETGLYLLRVN